MDILKRGKPNLKLTNKIQGVGQNRNIESQFDAKIRQSQEEFNGSFLGLVGKGLGEKAEVTLRKNIYLVPKT